MYAIFSSSRLVTEVITKTRLKSFSAIYEVNLNKYLAKICRLANLTKFNLVSRPYIFAQLSLEQNR
jgi:hypothetical protein